MQIKKNQKTGFGCKQNKRAGICISIFIIIYTIGFPLFGGCFEIGEKKKGYESIHRYKQIAGTTGIQRDDHLFRKTRTATRDDAGISLALIVTGVSREERTDPLAQEMKRCGDLAYLTLILRGYSRQRIYYLSDVRSRDVDGNGYADDIDDVATLDNLAYSMTDWINGHGRPVSSVWMYWVGHGGSGTFAVNGNETVFSKTLDGWLDAIQTEEGVRVGFVYDACKSGSFIPGLATYGKRSRIVITSTQEGQNANFLKGGLETFSFQFWSGIAAGYDIEDAYIWARQMMSDYQLACIDADGNGLVNEKSDQLSIFDMKIDGNYDDYAKNAPVIGALWLLENGSALDEVTVQARGVAGKNGISHVFGVGFLPSFDMGAGDLAWEGIRLISFSGAGETGVYEGSYSTEGLSGLHHLSVYAMDETGIYSSPFQVRVVRESGATLAGDWDGNNRLEPEDAIFVMKNLSGLTGGEKTAANLWEKDIDGDGNIGLAESIDTLLRLSGFR